MASVTSKGKIMKRIRSEAFNPSFLSFTFHPFFFIRRALYANVKRDGALLTGRLLDFGCGQKPYRNLFVNVDEYVGVDMQVTGHDHTRSQVDVYYDGKHLPFESNSFDSILSSEVFEHIFNLPEILSELERVLKPGGTMLITVPFAWNEHEVPFDFARYTSFGIANLLEKHNFEVVSLKKAGHFASVIFQMVNLYIFDSFMRILPKSKWHYIFILPIIGIVNLTGIILCGILPRNDSYFFNNIVLARKK